MSDKTEWFHGVLKSEFWTVYRGWRLFVRKSSLGWHWSIMREGLGRGSMTDDRPSAEAAAFAAVDIWWAISDLSKAITGDGHDSRRN